MIEFIDSTPDLNLSAAEYVRLLGYPRGWTLEGRALELADEARAWYAEHGRPWVYARESDRLAVDGDRVTIDDVPFTSGRLGRALREAGADRVVVAAVSAGAELEMEAQRRWRDGKPDEYFFLEVLGSAVVEHLVMMAGARLCAHADVDGRAVLPHYSPGYPDWDIVEQGRLLDLVGRTRGLRLPGLVEALDSGMLRPKKSLLAAFGVTPLTERVRRLTDLVPCENCSLAGCAFRRAPYTRARRRSEVETVTPPANATGAAMEPALDRAASYSLNAKALRRWATERLTLQRHDDGTLEARFRYDGTTCSNMGRPFQFQYTIHLGPRAARYPILAQRCAPAPGDEGHAFMCRYRAGAPQFLAAIEAEHPLLGHPLNDVLQWRRPASAPSCYCEVGSGSHKWGLVLETLHFALAQLEPSDLDPSPEGVL